MVIKRSTAPEVASLLADLRAGSDADREAAAARLAVIGTRAVEGLIAVLVSEPSAAVRASALSALEAIGDPRAIEPAFALLGETDPAVALPAAAVLRRALDSPRGTDVLERLATTALDTEAPQRTRLSALEALKGLSPKAMDPIRRALKNDASAAVRGAVAGTAGPTPEIDTADALREAAAGELPDDPDAVRRWLSGDTSALPLPVLHRLVQAIRGRENATDNAAGRVAWMTARAAAHQALAERGSRVALYDLREMIDAIPGAPVEMLAALERVGDASCLESIAAATVRLAAPGPADAPKNAGRTQAATWWRQHLITAFRTIVAREKLTERHTAVKRVRSRWPDLAIDLLGPPKR